MGLDQNILSAITTSGVFITALGENKKAGIIAAVVSIMALVLSAYAKKYDLGGMAQKHAAAAASIWDVRENYFSLLTDIRAAAIGPEDIRKRRDKLQNDLYKIYKGSPRTISKAYSEASKALQDMEEMTFSDEEIDKFLPKSIKKPRE